MKKFLSVLLVVLMLASISALAFAAPSPSQDPEPVLPVVPAPKEKEKESEEAEEAEEAEEEATKTIEENKTVAEDEQGKQAVVCLGKLSNDATGQMKKDHKALLDTLVDAKKAVAENEKAAIPEEIKADFAKAEGPMFPRSRARLLLLASLSVQLPPNTLPPSPSRSRIPVTLSP